MDRSTKCPKCKAHIDIENDLLPKGEWLSPEWPIYKCTGCGSHFEKSSKNSLYIVFGAAIVIAIAQLFGGVIGYFLSGGNERVGNIVGWVATAVCLLWLALKPMRLVERGGYAKQH